MRYKIIYCKTWPLTTWADTQEQAEAKAQMLRRSGYDVSVWECTTAGAKLTTI